jgi:hypothetical protein
MKELLFVFLSLTVLPAQDQRAPGDDLNCPMKTHQRGDATLSEEIASLVHQLGDESFAARESATKRLREIGVPALDALRQASVSADREVRRRAQDLLAGIHPPRADVVNGARFRVLADREWMVPKPGKEYPIHLVLEITNVGKGKRRFNLFDTMYVRLADEHGNRFEWDGGRIHISPGHTVTPPLKKGEKYTFKDFDAKLRWDERGTLRLEGTDGFGGVWYYRDIARRKYLLSVEYANERVLNPNADVPLWMGRVKTNPLIVEVK